MTVGTVNFYSCSISKADCRGQLEAVGLGPLLAPSEVAKFIPKEFWVSYTGA